MYNVANYCNYCATLSQQKGYLHACMYLVKILTNSFRAIERQMVFIVMKIK
jgi:hypothetical protein